MTPFSYDGVTTTYTYDSLNRMTRTDYPDGTFVRTVYDVTGQVDFMEDHRGMTDYTYDVRDRLQRIDYPNGTCVEYGYDITGNRIRLTTPNQQVIYTYDELNRLETVTDASGVATYGYDAVGNRDFTDYANGTRAEYVYDDLNRLLQLTNYDALGGIMTDHVYTLGNAGNRTQMAETLPTGARVVDYVYDDLYRLVEEQVTDSVHGDQITTWTYDQVGNRQTQTVDDGTIVTTTYTYDDNDRLLTEVGTDSINYRYDANGNTLDKAVNGLVEVVYEYDYENRLIATDNATYAYDPSGIRQSKVENGQGVIYLVDPNRDYAQVIEEQDAMGQAQVIYSYGDDLLTQTRSEGTYQYHYDGLGSTRALSDVFGADSDSYIYSAFGELEEQAGTTPNAYLYTGEQFDPNLGWYYLRARYYNPVNGRFPTMDTWMGRSADPRTLHKYLYTHADPVNGIDPSGRLTLLGVSISSGQLIVASSFAAITGLWLYNISNTEPDSPVRWEGSISYGGAAYFGGPTLMVAVLDATNPNTGRSTRIQVTTLFFGLGFGAEVNTIDVVFTTPRESGRFIGSRLANLDIASYFEGPASYIAASADVGPNWPNISYSYISFGRAVLAPESRFTTNDTQWGGDVGVNYAAGYVASVGVIEHGQLAPRNIP